MQIKNVSVTVLLLNFFRSPIKSGMTTESIETILQTMLHVHELLIRETRTPATVIPGLMRDLKITMQ